MACANTWRYDEIQLGQLGEIQPGSSAKEEELVLLPFDTCVPFSFSVNHLSLPQWSQEINGEMEGKKELEKGKN